MRTRLIEIKQYRREYKGAEIRFTRTDGQRTYIIYGSTCYESWQQWGAPKDVLSDNVPTIERWRQGKLEDLSPVEGD